REQIRNRREPLVGEVGRAGVERRRRPGLAVVDRLCDRDHLWRAVRGGLGCTLGLGHVVSAWASIQFKAALALLYCRSSAAGPYCLGERRDVAGAAKDMIAVSERRSRQLFLPESPAP